MIQNLQELSLEQLRMIEDSLDSYLFKQPLSGEDFHKAYRKNKQSFDQLIRQTVKLERIIRKAFQKQKEQLPTLVQLHRFTAAEEEYFMNDDEWDAQDIDMAGDINVGLMPIYTNGAQTTAEELNIGSAIDASHAPAQKFLTNYSLKLARDINATTKTNIKQAIQTSLSLGENRDALTSRINDIIDNEYRSQMIAQTESIRAYSQGRLAVGRDIGYDQKTWNAQDDACTYCAALDGETIDINDSWDGDIAVVDSAPLHPNCRCDNALSRSDDNVSAKEKLQSIKAGWITRNGAHVLLPDDDGPSTTGATIMNPAQIGEAALDRMDFTQPTKVPTDGSFSRYHAEHMLKYNAALQADHDRQNDPNIPTNIKDIIYSADVGGNVFPTGMAEHILENLPSGLSQNESLTKTLRQWGKSTEMVWKIKNNIQQQKTV